jgi:DNA polymerase III epsilon subunit-like protein
MNARIQLFSKTNTKSPLSSNPSFAMRYICFDTETNGFVDRSAKWPNYTMPWESHPVQISIDIVDEDGTVSHAYDTIIAGATGFAPWVHANVPITLEQVETDGRPFREVLGVFADLIKDGDTLVAHNIDFDINRVIGKSSKKMGIDSPAVDRILATPRFCNMRCAYSKSALGNQPKLSKLCEHFGVTLDGAQCSSRHICTGRVCRRSAEKGCDTMPPGNR